MNKIVLMGRLVRDPEVRYTQTGKVVTQITVAVDRPFTNQEGQREADFIPVIFWGKQAEAVGNNFKKGQRILLEGRLQIRSYDAKDGGKRWVAEVIASTFEFIERKDDSTNAGAAGHSAMDSFGQEIPGIPFDEEIPF